MTQFHVLARRSALAATVACVFAGTLLAWPSISEARKTKAAAPQAAGPAAQGPQAGSAADDKAAATEAAHKAYDAGLKDYAGGRTQSAIEQLSTAIKSGSLTSPAMAKALLTRGLAYKKSNKPGQAISDFTSAIWLKNGLGPAEQKSAIAERSGAYQMAGLPDTSSTPDQRAIGAPAAGSTAAATTTAGPNAGSAGLSATAIAEAANAQKAVSATASTGPSAQPTTSNVAVGGETTLQQAASPGVAAEAPKPASSGIGSIFGWGQSSQAAEAPAPAPASSGSSVGGFFSNMFGGGAAAQQQPAPEAGVTTSSTAGAMAPETSSWNSATTVAANTHQQVVRAENASYAPEAKPRATALTKGKFKIHIAAVRSRVDAETLAQRLVAEHGAELGNHVPIVDEAVIGSMGTFYRVRIGGYASQDEPRDLCNKLRTSGLDCLVVTN